MKKTWKITILTAAMMAGTVGAGSAHASGQLTISIGLPVPVVYAPAPVYHPAPQVVYLLPPYSGVYYQNHHPRHHHRRHHHWR